MSIDNLYNEEGRKKIDDIAESIDFCMMATNLGTKPFHAIPMSTKKVDEKGCIWFLSGKDSDHNRHINMDNSVQLIYSDPGDMTFLKLFGEAEITEDKEVLEDLYGKSDDAWFDGLDDPNLSAIKFIPKQAYYWEPKSNKFVSMLKMGIGAITGDEPDLSEHGAIRL